VADDELDIELRSPAEVAVRCIALASLIRRLSIESLAAERMDDGLAGDAFDLRAWLQSERLWETLTIFEVSALDRPLGDLTDDELATMAWQAEGLASLGWALGLSELAPLGELSHVEAVLTLVPSPWDATGKWRDEASLRPEPEIAHERDRAELFEWRIGVEGPRRASTGSERAEYVAAIAEVASEAEASGLADVLQGDVMIAGVPPSSLDANALERLAILAEERLRAMNWLCGFGDSWDRVPLDV
jgi:hypothetical protein